MRIPPYLREIVNERIIAGSLIEDRGYSQDAGYVTTIEVVSPAKGHLLAMTSSDTPQLSTRPGAA
jgi:hypothetical protein